LTEGTPWAESSVVSEPIALRFLVGAYPKQDGVFVAACTNAPGLVAYSDSLELLIRQQVTSLVIRKTMDGDWFSNLLKSRGLPKTTPADFAVTCELRGDPTQLVGYSAGPWPGTSRVFSVIGDVRSDPVEGRSGYRIRDVSVVLNPTPAARPMPEGPTAIDSGATDATAPWRWVWEGLVDAKGRHLCFPQGERAESRGSAVVGDLVRLAPEMETVLRKAQYNGDSGRCIEGCGYCDRIRGDRGHTETCNLGRLLARLKDASEATSPGGSEPAPWRWDPVKGLVDAKGHDLIWTHEFGGEAPVSNVAGELMRMAPEMETTLRRLQHKGEAGACISGCGGRRGDAHAEDCLVGRILVTIGAVRLWS